MVNYKNYKIFFKKSAQKELDKIPKQDLQRIVKKIKTLEHDPRPVGSEKLSGQEKYRIRQGDYRIIYAINDDQVEVWVVKIAHRRLVYRSF